MQNSLAQINKQILRIALPNILGNITVPLLGIVDTILMAYKGEDATVLIGSIALGSLIFNALYWNLNFLRPTITGITAQAVGTEDVSKQAATLTRGLLLAFTMAMLILIFHSLIERFGLSLLTNTENIEAINYARDYYRVRIWAAPAVLLLFALQGWFYGMQNAIIPFILTTFLNLTNIVASIYCVRYLDMDADGVAMGTLVAQYVSLLLGISLLFYFFPWVRRHTQIKILKNIEQFKEFFGVSGYVFGRNIMLFAVFSTFTYYSSSLSGDYFAANQLLIQLLFFMSFAVDGVAYAAEALVGKFKGAGLGQELNTSIKWCLIWGVSFGFLFSVSYMFFGSDILAQMTPDASLVSMAVTYLPWLSLITIFGSIAFIWDGVYIGATLALPMFVGMILSTAVFFLCLYILIPSDPEIAIWAAMTTYMVMRGIFLWFYYGILWRRGEVIPLRSD